MTGMNRYIVTMAILTAVLIALDAFAAATFAQPSFPDYCNRPHPTFVCLAFWNRTHLGAALFVDHQSRAYAAPGETKFTDIDVTVSKTHVLSAQLDDGRSTPLKQVTFEPGTNLIYQVWFAGQRGGKGTPVIRFSIVKK